MHCVLQQTDTLTYVRTSESNYAGAEIHDQARRNKGSRAQHLKVTQQKGTTLLKLACDMQNVLDGDYAELRCRLVVLKQIGLTWQGAHC